MRDISRTLVSAANAVEQRFDRLRFDGKRRLGLLDPFEILPYRGHGTARSLFLKGRVLEERGITRSGRHDTPWDNLRNMARRFASDEVPSARVRASFGGLTAAKRVATEQIQARCECKGNHLSLHSCKGTGMVMVTGWIVPLGPP